MNYVNISNHTRVAGRQVGIVHYAGGKMPKCEKCIEKGNFPRATRRLHGRRVNRLTNEMGMGC